MQLSYNYNIMWLYASVEMGKIYEQYRIVKALKCVSSLEYTLLKLFVVICHTWLTLMLFTSGTDLLCELSHIACVETAFHVLLNECHMIGCLLFVL